MKINQYLLSEYHLLVSPQSHAKCSKFRTSYTFQIEEVLSFAKIKPANLQVESHPHLPNLELLKFCKKQGISFVAYSPLGEFDMKTE